MRVDTRGAIVDQILQAELVQSLNDTIIDQTIERSAAATIGEETGIGLHDAFHNVNGADRGLDNISGCDFVGRLGERVSAPFAAFSAEETAVFQCDDQLLQITPGDSRVVRYLIQADEGAGIFGVASDVYHHSQRIPCSGGQFHLLAYPRCGP